MSESREVLPILPKLKVYKLYYLGMYKDQIYFLGAVEILKNRKKLNFTNLHCGKISVEDCLKLT